jgi:ChrR Cupin-like domain
MEWKPSQFEGVEIKVLYENKEAGEMTCLLHWQPGTTLPFHKHQQSWVISGSRQVSSNRTGASSFGARNGYSWSWH